LSSRDVVRSVWESTEERAQNIHHQCGLAVENILRESINRRTLDNITVVMIGFKNFKQKLFPRDKSAKSNNENLIQKEMEITSLQSPSMKALTQTSFSFKHGYKVQKDKTNEQENTLDLSQTNSSQNLKKESYLTDNEKKSTGDKTSPLADISLANKKVASKRGTSSIGLSESQKFESLKHYHNQSIGTYKSMDYRNGEFFKHTNYGDSK
jgi:hypothetical protein